MRPLRLSTMFVLAVIVASAACGARTGLDVPDAPSGPPVDGGRCSASGVTPGSVVWQTSLPDSPRFTGPWAADPSGTTYFIGTPSAYPQTYSLVALDACGTLLWQVDGVPTDFINEASVNVMISHDQVIVQWGAVDAFDRATGTHQWNASLRQYASQAGFGNLAFDDSASIGPSACDRNGTVFLPLETATGGVQVLAISPGGALAPVATLPRTNEGVPIGFVVDGAGQLDVLMNTTLAGAFVRSVTPAGAPVFSASFTCASSFDGPLAAGTDMLLMQTAGCALTLQGAPAFSFSSRGNDFAVAAIDGADDVYVGGTTVGVRSFDATGRARWMATPSQYVVGGPLLAEGHQLFVVETADGSAGAGTVNLVALDAATGVVQWTRPYDAGVGTLGEFDVVLTAAAQIVFAWNGRVTAVASGRLPDATAPWPSPNGSADGRRAATSR